MSGGWLTLRIISSSQVTRSLSFSKEDTSFYARNLQLFQVGSHHHSHRMTLHCRPRKEPSHTLSFVCDCIPDEMKLDLSLSRSLSIHKRVRWSREGHRGAKLCEIHKPGVIWRHFAFSAKFIKTRKFHSHFAKSLNNWKHEESSVGRNGVDSVRNPFQ